MFYSFETFAKFERHIPSMRFFGSIERAKNKAEEHAIHAFETFKQQIPGPPDPTITSNIVWTDANRMVHTIRWDEHDQFFPGRKGTREIIYLITSHEIEP